MQPLHTYSLRAREALRGHWRSALTLLLIACAWQEGLPLLVEQVWLEGTPHDLLLALIEVGTFMLIPGVYAVFIHLLKAQSHQWTDLLCGFKRPVRSVLMGLLVGLLMKAIDFVYSLLLALLGVVYAPAVLIPLVLNGITLLYLSYRFSARFILFTTRPEASATSLLSHSWKITRGHLWHYIRILLPCICCSLPFIAFRFGGRVVSGMLSPEHAAQLYAILSPLACLLSLPLRVYFYALQTAFFLDLDADADASDSSGKAGTTGSSAPLEQDMPDPDSPFFDEEAFNKADEKCREKADDVPFILQPLIDRIRNSRL